MQDYIFKSKNIKAFLSFKVIQKVSKQIFLVPQGNMSELNRGPKQRRARNDGVMKNGGQSYWPLLGP